MLESTNSKNLSYPQIFDQQSLKTYTRVPSFNFLAEVCVDNDTYCILSFHRQTWCSTFTNIENGLWILMSQLSARWNQWMTKNVFSILAWYESHWLSLWFFQKVMPDLRLAPIWNKRSVSLRSCVHEIELFPPYCSVQTCEQTRVCHIWYTLLIEKLITYRITHGDYQVTLKTSLESVFWCKSKFSFFCVRELLSHPVLKSYHTNSNLASLGDTRY